MNIPFLSQAPHFVEHEVDGAMKKFYRLSVYKTFRLRCLAGPVIKALSDLFPDKKNDISTEQITSTEKDGTVHTKVAVTAASSEVTRFRAEQQAAAAETLIASLMNEETGRVLMDVIIDCLKDDFEKEPSASEKDMILKRTPTEVFVELLVGVAKANEKIFSPFLVRVREVVTTLKGALATKEGKPESESQPTDGSSSGPTSSTPS